MLLELMEISGKVHPVSSYGGTEGRQKYNSTLSLTSVLDGGGWLDATPPDALLPEIIRYPMYRSLSGPQNFLGG
jgi:hypothetical protein